MNCERCFSDTRVIDSRDAKDHWRRRRQCVACDHRFTTFEISGDYYHALVKANRLLMKTKSLLKIGDSDGESI